MDAFPALDHPQIQCNPSIINMPKLPSPPVLRLRDVLAGTWGYVQAAHEILEQTAGQGFKRVAVVSENCQSAQFLAGRHVAAAHCQGAIHRTSYLWQANCGRAAFIQ